MNLIAISEDTLINPEHIASVEKRPKRIVVTLANGQQHQVTKDMDSVMQQLIRAGLKTSDQFFAL